MKQLHCPECGRTWEDDASRAGQAVFCPNCTEVLIIPDDPSQDPATVPYVPAATPAAPPLPEAIDAPPRSGSDGISAPPIVIPPLATPPQEFVARRPPPPPEVGLAPHEPLQPVQNDLPPRARFLVNTLLGVASFLIVLILVIHAARWTGHRVVIPRAAPPEKSTEAWIADLQGSQPAARGRAAEAIVERGAPALIDALDVITAIQSDNSYRMVNVAVTALAARGSEIIKPLREALRCKRAGVRIGAASVLCQMGKKAKGAVHPLGDALGDDNPSVRRLAVTSLGNCGADAAPVTLRLIRLLTHEDRDTRRRTVVTLGQIGPGAQLASDALVAVRDNDRDSEIARLAGMALYQVDLERVAKEADAQASEEIRGLVGRLAGKDPAGRVVAANALAAKSLGAVYAMPALAKALGDPDKWVRQTAAKALGSMGDAAEPTIPNLQRLTADPEPEVQAAAEEALKEVAGKNL